MSDRKHWCAVRLGRLLRFGRKSDGVWDDDGCCGRGFCDLPDEDDAAAICSPDQSKDTPPTPEGEDSGAQKRVSQWCSSCKGRFTDEKYPDICADPNCAMGMVMYVLDHTRALAAAREQEPTVVFVEHLPPGVKSACGCSHASSSGATTVYHDEDCDDVLPHPPITREPTAPTEPGLWMCDICLRGDENMTDDGECRHCAGDLIPVSRQPVEAAPTEPDALKCHHCGYTGWWPDNMVCEGCGVQSNGQAIPLYSHAMPERDELLKLESFAREHVWGEDERADGWFLEIADAIHRITEVFDRQPVECSGCARKDLLMLDAAKTMETAGDEWRSMVDERNTEIAALKAECADLRAGCLMGDEATSDLLTTRDTPEGAPKEESDG